MERVLCIDCVFSQPESEYRNGVWVENGKRFCYASNSVANKDKFDQLCPRYSHNCKEFKRESYKD